MGTISFTEGPVPSSYKDSTYNSSAAGRARRTKYRHTNSKWITDATYLARPFVAWDGEGVTVDGQHLYVLLANSRGGYIANPQGLSTVEVLRFVIAESRSCEGSIHVVYGGGYDFNCWLADLPRASVATLYRTGHLTIGPYRLAWLQGKRLTVSCEIDGQACSVAINDVVSFFQCSFVAACDAYLGDAFEERELIVSNKALRSSFTPADVPEVREYNRMELVNLVKLMNELRLRLNRCNLRPRRWDGPGAIATSLLHREGVKDAKEECPTPVAKAARYAYAGGRFELVRYGSVEGRAYEYDINSAYPAALRYVPNLASGRWEHLRVDQQPENRFALYHLSYRDGPCNLAGPLFCRLPDGSICYPTNVEGWYWGPEAALAFEYVRRFGGSVSCDESWVFKPHNPDDLPFAFIDKLYAQRQQLKAAGDGAHMGLKLALNSMYGKLAQQVGWKAETRTQPQRIPPYHQLEWAGYTTAYARATVMQAAMTNLPAVVAFETDAIFTSEPLDVTVGPGLGDFERIVFEDLTYVQSGIYFGTSDGKQVVKTRGVDKGSVSKERVKTALQNVVAADQVISAPQTRFIGAGQALQGQWDKWRSWQRTDIVIQLGPQHKREHEECTLCIHVKSTGLLFDIWHETECPQSLFDDHLKSAEFPVQWINADPAMYQLAELRQEHYERDYENERE